MGGFLPSIHLVLKNSGTVLKLRFLEVMEILEVILEVELVVMETEETAFVQVVSAARNGVGVELHQPIAVGVVVELVVMETEETEFVRTDSAALNGDGAELHLLIAVANVVYEEMRLLSIIKRDSPRNFRRGIYRMLELSLSFSWNENPYIISVAFIF